MDPEAVKNALQAMLEDVANKARADAMSGESDIGSVFEDRTDSLPGLDVAKVEQAIRDVDKATRTKEGARRLINGLLVVAKVAAKAAFPA
jgi:phosphoserine phosphatase